MSALTEASVAALAAISAAAPPLRPWQEPIVIDADGYASVPDPAGPPGRSRCSVFVHPGLRLGWRPFPPLDGVLLSIWGGPSADPGFEEDAVTAFMTRAGFARFAADIKSIADHLESAAS